MSRRGWDSWLLTGMRSAYFCLMRSASALRFSNGCSSLNLERMLAVWCGSGGLMRLLLEICRLNREVVVVVGSGLCCGKVSEWLEGS